VLWLGLGLLLGLELDSMRAFMFHSATGRRAMFYPKIDTQIENDHRCAMFYPKIDTQIENDWQGTKPRVPVVYK
jgi:hypothetical protein